MLNNKLFCFSIKNVLTKCKIFANLDLSKVKRLARGVRTSTYTSVQNEILHA